MPLIRIQLVTNRFNPVSAAIRLRTASEFSHIEFVNLTDQTTLGSRSIGGVKIRPCAKDHYSRVEQFTFSGIEKAYEWGLTQIGKPYDFSGIAGILFNHDWTNDKRWFCADFIQMASIKGPFNPLLSTRPSNFIAHYTPRDFLLSRTLVYVEKGAPWI